MALFSQRDQIKSVGNGITFRRDLTSESDILTALTGLSDTVAGRLRKHQLKCGGVKVDIRDPQFNDVSRQRQIEVPTNLATEIKQEALAIIRSFWPAGKPIRQITVTAINLCGENDDEQLSFFGTGGTLLGGTGAGEKQESASRESVERTMDEIRAKFGKSAIQFGQVIDNDIGLDV